MAIKIQGTDVVNDNRELKNITNADNIIEQPTNISPSDNATDIGGTQLGLTLELSSYSSLFGGQAQVEFQIAAESTTTETKVVTVATGTLYQSGDETGNVFYIDASENPPLTLNRGNTYVFDQSDASNGGHPLQFQEIDGTPYNDGVTVNGTAGTSGANVTFVVPEDAPDDLEYYCNVHGLGMGGPITVEEGTFDSANLVLDISEVSSTSNSYTIGDVRSILSESTTYYWRGRYQDNNSISSQFSEPTEFTTAATFVGVEDPSITSPSNGATSVGETPTITSSAFATFGTSDTHESSDWQIATDSNFTNIIFESLDDTSNLESITVPSGTLLEDTQHYVRVRHTGATLGDSGYSDTVSFSTSTSFVTIDTPSITSPSDGAVDVDETPTITSSAFSVFGGSDTHESSDWQIATDASFTSIAVESLNDTSNLESFTVPSGDLDPNTTYYVRVRHTGINEGDSDYSNTISFTTYAATINAPSITQPSDGETGVNDEQTFKSSSFSVSNWSDTHESSDWQISTDPNFTTDVTSYNDTTNLVTFAPPDGSLNTNTTYYVRVRHNGNKLGDGNYSDAIQFTTRSSFVSEDVFTSPGDYTWIAPDNVTTVSVVVVGGGGNGTSNGGSGGSGGALAWKNDISVTPNQAYDLRVGSARGDSWFINTSTVRAEGGNTGDFDTGTTNPAGGFIAGDGGGDGGYGGFGEAGYDGGGGGGAGGYSGTGGGGGGFVGYAFSDEENPQAGSGGGGGGGGACTSGDPRYAGGGGGVGLFGEGASGSAGSNAVPGNPGGGGSGGENGGFEIDNSRGGNFGGGGGSSGGAGVDGVGDAGGGAIRIVYGSNVFP